MLQNIVDRLKITNRPDYKEVTGNYRDIRISNKVNDYKKFTHILDETNLKIGYIFEVYQ